MNIDIRIALAALRKAYGECTAVMPNLSLRAQLLNYASSSVKLVAAGVVKSNSANNQHTAFDTGSDAKISAPDVVAMWTFLVERFDQSTIDWQTGAVPSGQVVANPTDLQVEQQMETYLRPVTGYTNNFMYLVK